jgi:hypothetical protein
VFFRSLVDFNPIGLDAAVGGEDYPRETSAIGVSIRLVIFTSMGLSHASFVSKFVSHPSDSVKPIEREEVRWSGRRDSNPI